MFALRHRGVNRAVEHQAVALIVVGAAIVLPDIEIVDRRAEEELADIVERLRIRVGNTIAAPARRPLNKRDMQAVVVRIGERRILAVVAVVRIRTASIVVPGGDAGRHILIDRNNQMQSAHVLVADAQRVVPPSCCSISRLPCSE